LQAGYHYVPYSSLESVIERNKGAYYIALRRTQTTIRTGMQDWEPWVLFFLRSLQTQVKHLEVKVEREKIILATLPQLSSDILEMARVSGKVTIRAAAVLTGANRNTIKLHLQKLVSAGHLNQHGAGRGAYYGLV
jgi:Fic family protein